MEFLVSVKTDGLSVLAEEELENLRRAEKERGEDHIAEGRLVRMWRLPGQQESLAVWKVADADELHRYLTEMPLFPHLGISVTPLARHYLEESPAFLAR